jgi:sterol 24-C-methyltransferase
MDRALTTSAKLRIYRATTMLRALLKLSRLEARDVDAFLDSYILFDGDWSKENGKSESHIVDYYRVLNHLCALGNVEKMYIPPSLDERAGVTGNQTLFERKMCADIAAGSGDHVLDIGCGRGRVACHVAELSGARVTGLNIDQTQIDNAASFARMSGLAGRCEFVRGNLNDPLPFPDASFDGGYQIQAFTYARDRERVFAELFRVLKPGARFSFLDWVRLPAYDPSNPRHVELINKTRFVIGGVELPTPEEVYDPMSRVGFEVSFSGDLSVGGHQSSLIAGEDRYFHAARRVIHALVGVRILPRHFKQLFDRLVKDIDAFIESDTLALATTSYQIIACKPPRQFGDG